VAVSGKRHDCLREVVCKSARTDRDENIPALIENLSTGGMRLVLRRCYEPGRVLAVSWPYPHGGMQRTLMVHVIHGHNDGGGTWSVGCSFLDLVAEKELASLL